MSNTYISSRMFGFYKGCQLTDNRPAEGARRMEHGDETVPQRLRTLRSRAKGIGAQDGPKRAKNGLSRSVHVTGIDNPWQTIQRYDLAPVKNATCVARRLAAKLCQGG